MAFDFNTLVGQLEGMGFYEVILPFLLIFTMSYGILTKINLFGKGGAKDVSARINPIISLILAFFFVRNEAFVEIVTKFFPRVSIFIIILFGFLLILALFGRGSSIGDNGFGIFLIIAIVYVIWSTYDLFNEVGLPWNVGFSLDWLTVIIIVVIVAVIWGVVGGGGDLSLAKVGGEFPEQ